MSKKHKHHIDHDLISPNALKVVKTLHKAGYEGYLVGGCIRDILLNKSPKDFDVVTNALPEQVKHVFRNCRLIGRRFRLAHILFGREIIEVATFRSHVGKQPSNGEKKGRLLVDNEYGKSLKDDALRRDFTINALCYDPIQNKIHDFSTGLEDIANRKIRVLGDPEHRYREDPVRMLRAIRFKAKLGFEIEEKSNAGIDVCRDTLFTIPPARLFDESLKMFHTGHAVNSYTQLKNHGMLGFFYPTLVGENKVNEPFIKQSLANTDIRVQQGKTVNPAFLIAVFLWTDINVAAKKIAKKTDMPMAIAIQKGATEVLSAQCRQLSIPKRFTNVMRDIWGLQARLETYKGKKAKLLLAHPRFRAAYDFLCLRAESGEDVGKKCEWWTEYQKREPIPERVPYSHPHKKKRTIS